MNYHTIIIGGGHAGCEAASASARMGAKTAIVTMKRENLGELSCNPSIGGVAKGIMVREIDAMGGLMGQAADKAGIQFKVLNASKGYAVHSPRTQIDRSLYKKAMKKFLNEQENLDIIEGEVVDLLLNSDKKKVEGVLLSSDGKIYANSVIITTGTFLNGVIHMGRETYEAGRANEKPSKPLAETIKKLGLRFGRMKTGTPPRINKNTIDFTDLEEQNPDNPPKPFSYLTEKITLPQIKSYITYTNNDTHKYILDNLSETALYNGAINSKGPRYCPSIEDKLVRFSDKERHQIFLEPEGYDSNLIYPSGISSSISKEVQDKFIHSIKGFENCKIEAYAYAIEYDYIDPTELYPTMECKKIEGLFLAGQINGSTGYEEAGGQGIVAGINSALPKGEEFILDRSSSYIGVMIDDLTTLGADEPYRMFTSRSEYRLLMRADNADLRLTRKAISLGIISQERMNKLENKEKEISYCREFLQNLIETPNKLAKAGITIQKDGVKKSAYELLSSPSISIDDLESYWPEIKDLPEIGKECVMIEAIYAPYVKKQNEDISLYQREEGMAIPRDFDYNAMDNLSSETKEKLNHFRPTTIGGAKKIQGITAGAVMAILIEMKKSSSTRI